MAGGEPRLGTDSMYMGNHNSLFRSLQPIICQLHGYKNRTSENKIARYQPLDEKERRKLSLEAARLINQAKAPVILFGMLANEPRPAAAARELLAAVPLP